MEDPFDYPVGCDACGKEAGSCICPECPECGDHGNTDCYRDGLLTYSPEQMKGQEEAKRREAEDASYDFGALDDLW